MKYGVVVLGILGLLGTTGAAFAQEVPPARVGFQMDIRTGYSIPMGSVDKGDKTSDFFGGQVPIIVDIGGKVIPELFVGGYFGLGFGNTSGALKQACDDNNASCLAIGLHIGVEAQYHILPHASANPWIGYGLGLESLAFQVTQGNTTQSASFSGFEYARFSGGVDFRVSRAFGVGPFVDFSMGQFGSVHSGDTTQDITDKAAHQWLTLGARFVIFP